MALDLDDQTTRDYLGNPASLTLADKPGLPTSGLPAATGAGPSAPGGSGTLSAGTTRAGTTRAASQPAQPVSTAGVAASAPSGEVAEAGAFRVPAAVGRGPSSGSGAVGSSVSVIEQLLAGLGLAEKVRGALTKILGGSGADVATLDPSQFSLAGEGGEAVLDPSRFTLSGEGGESALSPADFTLGKVRLNLGDLPQLARLIDDGVLDPSLFSLSDDGAPLLDLSRFSLGGEDGGAVLDPSQFSLGVDPTIASDAASSGLSGVPVVAPAISFLSRVLPALIQGAEGQQLAGAFVKGGIGGIGAVSGGHLAALWNLPQTVGNLASLIEGNEADRRRGARTREAERLQTEILGPLTQARTPEAILEGLEHSVGGSTAGDALAYMIRTNLQGTYFTDTGHRWLPDPSLVPMLKLLNDLGFQGLTEPKGGDVGGVGEIIAGAGRALVSQEFMRRAEEQEATEQLSRGQEVYTPSGTVGGYYGDALGALGWEQTLRDMTGAITGEAITAPSRVLPPTPPGAWPGTRVIVPDTSGGEGGNQTYLIAPTLDPSYREALRAFDPEVAAMVEQAFADQAASAQGMFDAYANAP